MVMLFTASGNPLTDSAGNHLRTGQTPRTPPFTFSDGIVRGTVPLDKGEAASMCRLVAIDWLWLGRCIRLILSICLPHNRHSIGTRCCFKRELQYFLPALDD